jgi:indolepyruvate ferredoxin oxidoreductase beta subunit
MKPIPKEPLNLIIAGVGGQGNIVASQIIAMAALEEDLLPTIGETYGVSQRGGSVMSHVRIAQAEPFGPLIPRGHADILLGFEPLETIKVIKEFANPETRVILNPRPVYPIGILAGDEVYPPVNTLIEIAQDVVSELRIINATEMAQQAGDIRTMNIVMVGSLAGSGWLPIAVESYSTSIDRLFKGSAMPINRKAFEMGLNVGLS